MKEGREGRNNTEDKEERNEIMRQEGKKKGER
jgi:hypothetical protein